jgi:hypothetical protein
MFYPRCIGDKFWIINHARAPTAAKSRLAVDWIDADMAIK